MRVQNSLNWRRPVIKIDGYKTYKQAYEHSMPKVLI